MILLRQGTAREIAIGPFIDDADGKTRETALTITSSEVLLKKNEDDWAAKNESTSLVHETNGWYRCLLDATDTNTLGVLRLEVNEPGALAVWEVFSVVTANVWDTLFGSAKLDVNVVNAGGTAWESGAITAGSIATGAITNVKFAAGAIDAAAIAASAIDSDAIAADAITAAKVASDVSTEFATTYLGTVIPGAFGAGTVGNILGNRVDTAISTRASQTSVDTIDDFLDTEITSINTAVTTTIPDTITNLQSDTDDLQTRLPAALVSGRIDASVGAVANNAITAAAIATDAIDADALAASAINEIAAAVGALAGNDPGSVPAANASLLVKIDWLCALARNKRTVNRTTGVLLLRNDADSATISTHTITDDGITTTIPKMT